MPMIGELGPRSSNSNIWFPSNSRGCHGSLESLHFPLRMDTCCAGAEQERKAVLEFLEKLKCHFFFSEGEKTTLALNFLREILICCSRISPHDGFSLLPAKFHPKTKWALSLPKPCKGERNQIGVTHMVLMPGSPKKGCHGSSTSRQFSWAP